MKLEDRTIFDRIKDVVVFLAVLPLILISYVLPVIFYRIIFSSLAVLLCIFIPETYLMNKNLKMALPNKNLLQRLKIIIGVWFSLGLFFAEYFYIYRYSETKIKKLVNVNNDILNTLKNTDKGKLVISGHFANWELALAYASKILKQKINVVYRQSNNILLENLIIQKYKSKNPYINLIAKQDNAGIKIVKALKNKEIVVILADQRDSQNGILINFFNIPAYTNGTIYTLYTKLDVDVYFFCILRQNNIFKSTIYAEKFEFNKDITETEFLTVVNKIIEKYILKSPWQWFWVHNRWRVK